MKIVKRDATKAEHEKKEKELIDKETDERELYFEKMRNDKMFKKHVIDGLVKKELERITNIEWMYATEHLGESSNSRIGETLRRNAIVYRVLKNLLKPIIGND